MPDEIMDDATASDNCGEVTIEVSLSIKGDAAGNYVIVRTFTATDDAYSSRPQTITVEDTTAPEFTFVPADYTVECSDEMPMDDATASTTAEKSPSRCRRNHRGDAAGNCDRSHLHRHRRCWQQQLGLADHHRGRHHGAGVHLRACRLHGRMLDEMPMDDATASDNCGEVTIEVSSETISDAAGNYVIVRTFTATDDAGNSSSASQTITVEDTTAPEFTFVPADYTVECLTRCPWTTPRRQTTAGSHHRGRNYRAMPPATT